MIEKNKYFTHSLLILLFTISSIFSDDFSELKTECLKDSSKNWDTSLNRCVLKESIYTAREETESCQNSADPADCFMSIAEAESGIKEGSTNKKTRSTVGASLASVYAAALAMGSMTSGFGLLNKAAQSASTAAGPPAGGTTAQTPDTTTSTDASNTGGEASAGANADGASAESEGAAWCKSKMVFLGTTLVWLAGDLWLKSSAAKAFKKLKDKYKIETETSDDKNADYTAYENQSKAFQYLIEEQTTIKKNAGTRYKLHMAATLGYGGSLGFAIYEMFKPPIACKGGSGLSMIGSSPAIAIASGLMMGWNGMLAQGAKKEEKNAKDNIEELQDLMASFSKGFGGQCVSHDDMNNPRCFCYESDGEKNENRSNSDICKSLWASDEATNFLAAGSYDIENNLPSQGCLTVNGQYDEDCRCKNMVNSTTGQNACLKASAASISTQLGSALAIPQSSALNTALASGSNNALGSISAGQMEQYVARNKKYLGPIIKKAQNSGNFPTNRNLASLALQQAKKLTTPKSIKSANQSLGGSLSSSRPSGNLGSAISKIEGDNSDKLISNSDFNLSGGKGLKVANSNANKNPTFSWGSDSNSPSGNTVNTAHKKAKYNYGDTDINKNSGQSIWRLISQRYQKTGLKRLFD